MHDVVTVIDVIREAGVRTPPPRLSWAVGQEVAAIWRTEKQGQQPEKALAAKTRGGGSHCFAVYPPSWRRIIRLVVDKRIAALGIKVGPEQMELI